MRVNNTPTEEKVLRIYLFFSFSKEKYKLILKIKIHQVISLLSEDYKNKFRTESVKNIKMKKVI